VLQRGNRRERQLRGREESMGESITKERQAKKGKERPDGGCEGGEHSRSRK